MMRLSSMAIGASLYIVTFRRSSEIFRLQSLGFVKENQPCLDCILDQMV